MNGECPFCDFDPRWDERAHCNLTTGFYPKDWNILMRNFNRPSWSEYKQLQRELEELKKPKHGLFGSLFSYEEDK